MNNKDPELPSLSPALQSLVDAECQRPGYSDAQEARVWERIESSLDWIDSQPASDQPPAAARQLRPKLTDVSARGSNRRGSWAAAAVLLITLAGGAVAHAAYQMAAKRWIHPKPTVVAPPAKKPTPVPSVVPIPDPPARVKSDGPAASKPSVERNQAQIARERELLEMARAALGLHRLNEARTAIELHQRDFPKGELSEERESLTVQLLIARGEIDQARANAARFHQRYPSSIFWPSMAQQVNEATRRGE